MGYDQKINTAARAELENRRRQAESTAAQNLTDFLENCPRAGEIKRQLASNAAAAAKAVLAGGDVRGEMEKYKALGLALNREYEGILASCGLSRRDIEPQYTCPKCKDTGFVDGHMCECYRQLRRNTAYRQLSTELPLARCTFDSFSLDYYRGDQRAMRQMSTVLNACQSYAQNLRPDSPSFLFWGNTGLGKTHLSLAIANVALDKGLGVVYGSVQGFAVALEKERFDRDNEGSESTAGSLKSCDLLILDDLGTEFPSAYVNAAIYDVVNARLLSGKPTIISTNLNLSALEKRYSDRFASRIAGNYGMLEFMGKDIRIQQMD